MPIQLTPEGLRKIFPRAPQDILDAFSQKQDVLTIAGANQTRPRLAIFFANVEHECGGFTIKNLTENTNYSAERMAEVWKGRFPGGAAQVRAKYGTGPGWQLLALDDIYGSRMGNKPGTRDGSTFIGHGGPQWTGRDGHEALARILKQLLPNLGDITAEGAIRYAIDHAMQPEVCAAFWMWKGLNKYADVGNFVGAVKAWNGGTNGLADREALMAGNDPIISKLAIVTELHPILKDLPGGPDTPTPPKEVIDEATKTERAARTIAVGGATAAGANETAKQTEIPHAPILTSTMAFSGIGVAVVIAIVATVLIARKKAAIAANWF